MNGEKQPQAWTARRILWTAVGVLGIGALWPAFLQDAFKKLVPLDPVLCDLRQWWNNEPAPGSHFTILLGDLHRDVDRQHTDRVRHALEGQTGFHVKGTCKVLTIEPHKLQSSAVAHAVQRGQQMLKDNNADLLIWGEADHEYKTLRLRFMSREDYSPLGSKPYELKGTELPFDFHTDFNAQLVATAAASIEPVTRDIGTYLVPILEPAAAKLEHLTKHFPLDFTGVQRGLTHLSLGIAALSLAGQIGTDRWGHTAEDAYRAALSELNAADDPRLWIVGQWGLGSALMQRGQKEVGNQKLDDALAALTKVVEVLQQASMKSTREWWGLVQLDRGLALLLMGQRAGNRNRLRDACAAYDGALRVLSETEDPEWVAVAHAGRAQALSSLADFEGRDSQLDTQVLRTYKRALEILERKYVPLIRSKIQRVLAGFLIRLESSERLEEARILLEEVDRRLTRRETP